MGAAEVDVALRDGSHAELVKCSGEERCKGAGENHVAVPHGTTDRHTHLQGGGRKKDSRGEVEIGEYEQTGGEERRGEEWRAPQSYMSV